MQRRSALAALTAGALATVGVAGAIGSAAHAATTRQVAKSGADTGNCTTSPCLTITYALGQAVAGDTISVAAGNYHETVDIEKAVKLVGAGPTKTLINGNGLDPSNNGVYGVVYVGNAGGAVTVRGFAIANPAPFTFTGGEPEVVALKDANAGDTINIVGNLIYRGNDPNASTDFPIGVDTFKNAATTNIVGNVIHGVFQGVLAEDNGPLNVTNNVFDGLISGTQDTTTYPAEGVFVLSDLAGALTNQNVSNNRFQRYGGYGVTWNAGYDNGNCATTPCDGSISGQVSDNHFALTATPAGAGPASAIHMAALNNGNSITATINDNDGYVTSPDTAISTTADNGGSLHLTQSGNTIAVH
jgi:hypothetical protein